MEPRYIARMTSSSTFLTVGISAIAVLALGACKSTYSDVYSFKKNSFVAPVKATVVVPPTVIPADMLNGSGPAQQPLGGIPGVDAGGIPGVPAAPAAEAIPAAPPAGAVPGL